MLDKFTIIRSVDARYSNHEPNTVFQTGNLEAEPRTNPQARMYPAIGSIVAKMRGANHPSMPPYVAFMKSRSHIAFAGYLGEKYDPFIANQAARLPIYTNVGVDTGRHTEADFFRLPRGLTHERLHDRRALLQDFDALRGAIDRSGTIEAMDRYSQQAVEMLVGPQAQRRLRPLAGAGPGPRALRQAPLVPAGAPRPPPGRGGRRLRDPRPQLPLGLRHLGHARRQHPPLWRHQRGLKPLLPLFDHLITTLVGDLDERGLLDDVLVIAMGEFGRTPIMGTQGSTDGRNHWPVVMSMALAGGGFRHGQVIGATERDGGHIKERPVTPGDLAATIYHHMGVPLDATYLDATARPRSIVENNGKPLAELL